MAGLIATYLDDLARDLRVGPDLLDRILCETEAHLLDRAEHYRERGTPPDEAERRAIARFGSARAIARQFAADRATGAARAASRVLLPGVLCLWLVLQVGGHFLPAGSKPRDAGATAGALAATIDLYSLALVVALAGGLLVWWHVHRHPGVAMPPGDLGRVAAALAVVVTAEVTAGVTAAFLLFRLPGSPPPAVPAAMAASELLAVLVGVAFALRAIARHAALATIGEDSQA